MSTISNPILRGFNPDPAILRVGDDYYIATSTFQWFPGVQIHHSRDLVNWRVLTHPLTRTRQLDMRGCPNSGGIWAPCLSYDKGTFYLIYTNVTSRTGTMLDTPNYMVTATDIMGPWSEPIFLNASGFDPSLFHDDDGCKYLLNMWWDHRKGRTLFGGILMQAFSTEKQTLVGPVTNIFKGTPLGATEGPHLYKRDGWYYLITAEGGTGYGHAVTMARSRSIQGPYEVDPTNPILTAVGHDDALLKRSGHASLVETQNGEWYMTHLCGRPLPGTDRCILGRETAIQKCTWTQDGWLRTANGSNKPVEHVPAPDLPPHPFAPLPDRDDFDAPDLGIQWQTLRVPADPAWLSLSERPGFLRLRGRESLYSRMDQSLVARRLQAHRTTSETCLRFSPTTPQQSAGLICCYDSDKFYYLRVTWDETSGACLGISTSDKGRYDELPESPIAVPEGQPIYLRACIDCSALQFHYSLDAQTWQTIGPILDASKLADEYYAEGEHTGSFVGLCAQDLSTRSAIADFDYFVYREE